MASLNPLTRELVFKIVFYGPGLGGKTTTLQYIYAATKAEHRGKMVSLATPTDRTLYFDYLPIRVPRVRGMGVRLQLFTVPGQVHFQATRRLVLSSADGVVFVADSQQGRLEANRESLEDLADNLWENNRNLATMPHTFHWNKRDLSELVSVEELEKSFNPNGVPSLETVATRGDGVFSGLERITRLVLRAYEADLPKGAGEPSNAPGLGVTDLGIEDAIRSLTAPPAKRTPNDVPPRSLTMPFNPNMSPGLLAKGADGDEDDTNVYRPAEVHVPTARPLPNLSVDIPEEQEHQSVTKKNQLEAQATKPPPGMTLATKEATNGTPPREDVHVAAVAKEMLDETPRDLPPVMPKETPNETPKEIRQEIPKETPREIPKPPDAELGVQGAQDAIAALEALEVGTPETPLSPMAAPVAVSPSRPPRVAASPPPPLHQDAVFSMAALWPEAEREAVRNAEAQLAALDAEGAILACDVLVTRVLASAASLAGPADAPRDPGVVSLLLGLAGARYLAFRGAVRAARQKQTVSQRDAYECYAFALEARRARDTIGR